MYSITRNMMTLPFSILIMIECKGDMPLSNKDIITTLASKVYPQPFGIDSMFKIMPLVMCGLIKVQSYRTVTLIQRSCHVALK